MNLPRFIVTGHGRSGTTWLSRLLDENCPYITVLHEPVPSDRANYKLLFTGRMKLFDFLAGHFSKVEASPYAEVNSYLRYAAQGMLDLGIATVGLVRDGRRVVRSLMRRGCYQRPGYPEIPAPSEIDDPFEACCWYWARTYLPMAAMTYYPMAERLVVFRLEDLDASYYSFCALCNAIGVEPRADAWSKFSGRRFNASVADTPVDWEQQQRDIFNRRCGTLQEMFGYPLA